MAILIKRKDLEARIRAIAARDGVSMVEVVERAIPAEPPEQPRKRPPLDVEALWRSVGVEPPPPGVASTKADYDALYHDEMIDGP